MSEREVSAKEVLSDISSGLDDSALREKYKLSHRGLQNLYETLVENGLLEKHNDAYVLPTRSISAGHITRDILSGMTGSQLIRKYRLTSTGLQFVLRKLVDSGALDVNELGAELSLRLEATTPHNIRQVERIYLDFDVQAYDAEDPHTSAFVRDISERGIGLRGMVAEAGEIKKLVILGDALGQVLPFELEAECRWVKIEEDVSNTRSGFRITAIDPKDLDELKKLVKLAIL